jgi:tripartite motif-containing protein 2/3
VIGDLLPAQVWVAADGFVFVADRNRGRVQVLSPTLSLHSVIGDGEPASCSGVCANADVVVVSEHSAHRISVFNRRGGALLRRFGCEGSGDGQLSWPRGLCFMSDERHVAVADGANDRVSVLSIDGVFIRHVGVGVLSSPQGVACSAFNELVVADRDNRRVFVFSDAGELLTSFGDADFTGVAVHGSTVFAQAYFGERCVQWS